MVVHVVLLAVPAAAVTVASGFLHAFQFSFLLWPFNLALPLLRQLPRVCITLRAAAEHYDRELRASLSGRRRVPLLSTLGQHQPSSLRDAQRPTEVFFAHAMITLLDISY